MDIHYQYHSKSNESWEVKKYLVKWNIDNRQTWKNEYELLSLDDMEKKRAHEIDVMLLNLQIDESLKNGREDLFRCYATNLRKVLEEELQRNEKTVN